LGVPQEADNLLTAERLLASEELSSMELVEQLREVT
jgi:hypothetical protein